MFMVRTKIPGGVLTADQYLRFDDLAGRFGNDTLRVTTRQDVQFHGVIKANLRATIRALNETLVTTLGACGDVERNVVSCPAPLRGGLRDEALHVVRSISAHLLPRTRAYHEIWLDGEHVAGGSLKPEHDPIYGTRYLPRKFKTALAFPDDNCTDVHSNDLGFLVVGDGERIAGFNVLVGGGLGRTHGKMETYPRLADPLGFVPLDEVVQVAEAVITVQRDYGNRSDRRRARLKYLLDERGLDWFRQEVEQHLSHALALPAPVEVTGIHDHLGWWEQGDGRWFYGLFIENGRIRDTEDVQLRTALRRIVDTIRPGVHLTPQQNVLLTGISEREQQSVERMLVDHGVLPADRISSVRRWAMACPALPTCGLALAEAERALPGVIDELERELEQLGLSDARLTVRMTGCPNGCARPYTADLAFVGRSVDKYAIFLGGSMLGTRLGVPYADLVPRAQLAETVLPLFERYRDERRPGEQFGDYCHRVGPETLRSAGVP
jgi:sulfite reductase (ferredoxin)